MLPSFPPRVPKRRIPKRNFFRDALRYKSYREMFSELYRRYAVYRQVDNSRHKKMVVEAEQEIIDSVMIRVYALREQGLGWSKNIDSLPLEQKIWLDDAYEDQRKKNDEWADKIIYIFARWIFDGCKWAMGKDNYKLSDKEFEPLQKHIRLSMRTSRGVWL